MSLAQVMFWLSFVLIVVAVIMGIWAVWIPSTPLGRKLFLTNLCLLVGTITLTIVSRWLK